MSSRISQALLRPKKSRSGSATACSSDLGTGITSLGSGASSVAIIQVPAEERGAGAAISVLGYRLGMLVSGGLALWLADRYLGWQGMYWLMAACSGPSAGTRGI